MANMNMYNYEDDMILLSIDDSAVKSFIIILVAFYELLDIKLAYDKCSSSTMSYLGVKL